MAVFIGLQVGACTVVSAVQYGMNRAWARNWVKVNAQSLIIKDHLDHGILDLLWYIIFEIARVTVINSDPLNRFYVQNLYTWPLTLVEPNRTRLIQITFALQCVLVIRGVIARLLYWIVKFALLTRLQEDLLEYLASYHALLTFTLVDNITQCASTLEFVQHVYEMRKCLEDGNAGLRSFMCILWLRDSLVNFLDNQGHMVPISDRNHCKSFAVQRFAEICDYLHANRSDMSPKQTVDEETGLDLGDDHLTALVLKEMKTLESDNNVRIHENLLDLYFHPDIVPILKSRMADRDGFISTGNFLQSAAGICELRRSVMASYYAQKRALPVIELLISHLSFILSAIAILGYLDVNMSTLIVSGAAVFSGTTVALSFVYTDFIQSTILTVFTNPYDNGDRVRINDVLHIVKKINVYTTQFETLEGKILYLPHVNLRSMQIVNESRSVNASICVPLRMSTKTTGVQLEALKVLLQNYLDCNSTNWYRDSLFMLISDFKVQQYLEVTIWATLGSGWGSWRFVHDNKTLWYQYISRTADLLQLEFALPEQPIKFHPTSHQIPEVSTLDESPENDYTPNQRW
ncbi:mechanosensitive ion channel family protein [Gregarina niphandrodes]|uniref:Mechanosensitive ion channel family protein n=1 Tax=Gregarina niphandrodes TaxID=110365 RepID=A0A023B5P6_GRENI|nr:mechanosensitive ion channel family protein [Gregarina niphandrodes]EZG61536.1 mechanosensitive ion channel family protein [Gregarina niphandrodes]|eukprot:XP_011130742.1 mechanosensitive ion channel family protein [Gregarina niphandrodes]